MNREQISEAVDCWIDEQELPSRPGLKPIRKFDDLYPKDDEERKAYWDFMEWAMTRDFAVLLTLPKPSHEKDFWQFEDESGQRGLISYKPPSAHRTVRTGPYTAHHVTFIH